MHDDPERGSELMQALASDVDEAIAEVRALAHGIYPAVLSDRGLAAALRALARDAVPPTTVTISDRYPPEIEADVYYCCVEALQNVAKHAAGASGAHIDLHCEAELRFEVADDGPGFLVGGVMVGQGLTNMRDRLRTHGGTLDILSQPGKGVRVRGSVPAAVIASVD
jgi:signal transduction histidine kinase